MRRKLFTILGLTLVVAFFLAAYPFYVIRPFRYQGPRELALALTILQFRPFLEVALSVLAVIAAVVTWIQLRGRLWSRATLTLIAVLVVACGVLSRVNIYEKMFHPLDHSEFSAASQAKLDGAEEVISVAVNQAARAYPIRILSYHHIVNDTLGGLPIVATY